VLVFDNKINGVINKVMWGDRYHFTTVASPPTRDGSWSWDIANTGARYNALIAGDYEMGLFEPRSFATSALADGYSDERGSTSVLYNNGHGCLYEKQLLPCDWEWPYQSIQYSLPYASASDPSANSQPTYFKKMAWGSSTFYGTGTSLPSVWDTSSSNEAFTGWPADRKLSYSICILLGRTTPAGLTKTAAQAPTPNCAAATF